MIYYHGTRKDRQNQIENLRKIKRTSNTGEAKPQYTNNDTAIGYVHLTKCLLEAVGFALLASEDKKNGVKQEIVVYKIEISETDVELDPYEKRSKTIVFDGIDFPNDSAVRIDRDLKFGSDVIEFLNHDFDDDADAFEQVRDLSSRKGLLDKLNAKWVTILLDNNS